MKLKNTAKTYGNITKILHWLLIILIPMQFALIYWDNYKLHKSNGISILMLMVFFAVWSMRNIKPNFPLNMTGFEIFSAKFTHFLLYLSIILISLSGILMSLASGKTLLWYTLTVPNFIGVHAELAKFAKQTHYVLAWLVGILVCLHVLGAIKHIWLQDKLASRMLKFKIWCAWKK